MKDVFQAIPVKFCEEPGYMVSQYHNGERVVEQFVSDAEYKEFCEVANIKPIIIYKF